ncbi:DUF6186 family protein [Galbitalea soli]|uniref:Uncharacterized protein n=1 Tax=Galbitalea soli TaxID=1268042 RepID=A0A7C9TRQ9_9MICO|nr:DUF6186 family protein [Galbitalea soli]NEM92397.1 hypothetical protein [Galbitalea soli]NYJ31644.1 hypothetical protein [Galbitalea soli]
MTVSTIGFLLEAGAIVLLVILGIRDDEHFATIGDILDRVMATRAARVSILLFWWWLGWHFLVEPTVAPGA